MKLNNVTKKEKNLMFVCTLNTRTLRTEESLLELELALQNLKWDILGTSEMRRIGKEIDERKNYIIYNKGGTSGHRGIGFPVKIKYKNGLKHLKAFLTA